MEPSVRQTERFAPDGRPTTRYCEEKGCTVTTREGKPFCPFHVDSNPYAKRVQAELKQKAADDARVEKRGARAVRDQAITLQEILRHLSLHGPRTVGRLMRELDMKEQVMWGYVRALKQRKYVKLTSTTRGATIVNLASDR